MDARQAQAQALYASGREYSADGRYNEALAQFRQAVQIADSVADMELSKRSREALVQEHERRGDTPASSAVLQQIESQLTSLGSGDELALNLLAQARQLIGHYRYAEAQGVLDQALGYQNHSAIRKRLEFELARVFYQTGRLDEALAMLHQADISAHAQKRANSILDNGQALALLAAVQRGRGAFAGMRAARQAQEMYLGQQASYLYQRGLDELAAGTQRASMYFEQSLDAARRESNHDLADLALLQYCVAGNARACSPGDVEAAYQRQVAGGVPRHAVEAMYLHARYTAGLGRTKQAIETLRSALDEIHFLRHSLPGVLGSWYRERHQALFGFYLELLTGPHGHAEITSLLAVIKMRLVDSYDAAVPGPDSNLVDAHALRAKVAERAAASASHEVPGTVAAINRTLAEMRGSFKTQFAYLSEAGTRTYLRGLDNDEVLLTYHVSAERVHVWVGHKGRVIRRDINGAASLDQQLRQAHGLLANAGETVFNETMDTLGERLLGPITDLIEERIYWIPAGPLLGLPFDALRLGGHYLAEKHDVVSLLSLPAEPVSGQAFKPGTIDRVFVAGNPQDFSAGYALQFETTDEIRTVMDIFVGPGLTIVQGPALLSDEFQDPGFTQAGLAHLAMPGVIDLHDPLRSSLELSGIEDGPPRTRYRLENIQAGALNSHLVFLSSTRTAGVPQSAFSNKLGLVKDITRAGAGAVVADLWDNAGQADRAFLGDFYRQLRASRDIAGSLRHAKRRYIRNNRGTGLYGWAGYQLFLP